MKPSSLKELKTELNLLPKEELLALCLHLAKFKKENKEMLTYLVFESHNEQQFVRGVKEDMNELFEQINTTSYYLIKKSVRKILRNTKKYIVYSKKRETEVELLIHFSEQMLSINPSFKNNTTLLNIYERTLKTIAKNIATLHEDLQYDYSKDLVHLKEQIS
jgi:hypothetical protein